MVIWALFTGAWAAPIVCDDGAAAALLAEARIEESRAPVSHPELIPGLARASSRSDLEVAMAVGELCKGEGTLTLTAAESWQAADWSAHTFLLTRSTLQNCVREEHTIALSVGVRVGEAPRYRLRAQLPVARTPVGDCADQPRYRDETVIDGATGPVRIVLVSDVEGDTVQHSQVVVRSASPDGWFEQVLLDPAPARFLAGGSGPTIELTDRFEEKWVVAHGDRTGAPPSCAAVTGQTVWEPDGHSWVRKDGLAALQDLASRGLWRMAGQDGWFLVVAQDDEEDADRLYARVARLEAMHSQTLMVVPSASFPGLNPGFLIATPPPWPTEAEAEAAHRSWRPRRQVYVKRAWVALDPCVEEASPAAP